MGAPGLVLAQIECMAAGAVGSVDNTGAVELLEAQCVLPIAPHEAVAGVPFGLLVFRDC